MGLLDKFKANVSSVVKKLKTASAASATTRTAATIAGASNPVSLAAGAVAAQTALNRKAKSGTLLKAATINPITIAMELSRGNDPGGVPLDPRKRRAYFDKQKADRKAERAKASTTTTNTTPGGSGGLIGKARALITENPFTSVAVAAGAGGLLGAGLTALATKRKKKKSKVSKRRVKSTRRRTKRSSSRTRRTKRTTSRRYGTEAQYKRKGGKDVKYTKKGQPYIIKSNGRAQFIKRSR